MSITKIFKDSISVAKGNPLIFVPMLVASLFSALVGLIFAGSAVPLASAFSMEAAAANPEQMLAKAGAFAGGMMLFGILSSIAFLLTHNMTIAMADQALSGKDASLKQALSMVLSRIVPIVIAIILVGLIVGLGLILLILPGLVLAFFLMFTFISIITANKNAFQAIGCSFKTVGSHFGATFISFLIIIGMAIIFGLVNFVVALIPILGVILSLILAAAFTGFVSIFMVCVFRELSGTGEEKQQEVEV